MSTEAFLCPQCADAEGGLSSTPDTVSRVGASIQLSATLLDFLEAYLGIHSTATANDRGDPELLQVLGDSTWGLKAFMPQTPDRVFSAGGAAEMWMLNGTGGTGIDGTSFALRGLTSLDFANTSKPEDRVPLRVNFNLSYIFDNSAILVRDIENQRRRNITRIERYGLNVNRLDRLVPALGVEGMFEVVRPYVEWSIDIPSNRQDYTCLQNDVHAGDSCLQDAGSLTGTPSRLTLGARAYAFLDGLSFHGAFDIATGGMKAPFWEETQPESPWNLHFGIAYAADTEPRIERVKVKAPPPPKVEAPPPPPIYALEGTVVEKGSETPIADAIVRFEGRPLTGMITDAQGSFKRADLEPGDYTLQVSAPGYVAATCQASIDPSAASPEAAAAAPVESDPAALESAPLAAAPPVDGVIMSQVRCELALKPKLGSLSVLVLDASTGDPVPAASVTPSTADGRSITLQADEAGAIEVADVPSGPITLRIGAEGYYPTTRAIEITPEGKTVSQVQLAKSGRANIRIVGSDVKFRTPIEFEPGSSKLTAGSSGLLDELAAMLTEQPELRIEVQAHTDDSLPFQAALTLSTDRASMIRQRLVSGGIDASRVSARGMGGATPTVPNNSDRNKAKNNRIEVVIQQ
jgi:outer membrane protein OmpA-like peptidoglycan-associated protein